MKNGGITYKSFEVAGLFGHATRRIDFSGESSVTILAGPNGCGKTHVLKILRATLALDFSELMRLPFSYATLELDGSRSLRISSEEDHEGIMLTMRLLKGKECVKELSLHGKDFKLDESDDLPPWIHKVSGTNRLYDSRTDRYYSTREAERRFGVSIASSENIRSVLSEHPWLRDSLGPANTILIDTKRLDSLPHAQNRDEARFFDPRTSERGSVGRIGEYISEIRSQIEDARRESLRRSQAADEKFASNLLKRSRKTVRQAALTSSYSRLSTLNDELNANGLAGRALNVTIPSDTNPTERRVLDLFLQDWERKQAPLIPVHKKITALKKIVNGKFSGKSISFDSRGVLQFLASDSTQVQVNQLSSGEQHLLALFTLLLFSAKEGSIVLIDEPEISLHAAWKHSFVRDIEEVAEIANLSVVFATHSTGIINGRWDLVQELGVGDADV